MHVTKFWKTDQIVTLGLFHFIGLANKCIHTLQIPMQCHYQAWLTGLFFWSKFCRPCKFTTEIKGPTEGATWKAWVSQPNDREMSPRPSKHVWAYDWHFLNS